MFFVHVHLHLVQVQPNHIQFTRQKHETDISSSYISSSIYMLINRKKFVTPLHYNRGNLRQLIVAKIVDTIVHVEPHHVVYTTQNYSWLLLRTQFDSYWIYV